MKIRHGFVSNSSSSSFLIVNHKDIESIEDLDDIFPKSIAVFQHKSWNDQEFTLIPRKELLEDILKNLKKISWQEAMENHIENECKSYDYETKEIVVKDFTLKDFARELGCFRYEDSEKDFDNLTEEEQIKRFIEWQSFYTIGASDDTSYGSMLEHEVLPLISQQVYSHH